MKSRPWTFKHQLEHNSESCNLPSTIAAKDRGKVIRGYSCIRPSAVDGTRDKGVSGLK